MSWLDRFKRSKPEAAGTSAVTDELVRRIADLINGGRFEEAVVLAEQTVDPKQAGLAAMRYVD